MRSHSRLVTARLEARVLGPWLFALPLLAAGGLGGLLVVLHLRHTQAGFLALLHVAILEACLPLAAGIACATVAAHDSAIELQLSLPTPYRRTALVRFGLLLGWALLVEAVTALVLQALAPQAAVATAGALVLVWLAPTLWLGSAGALLALLLRSRSTAVALLGAIWLAQQVFHGYFALFGWTRPWFLFATLYAAGAPFWWTNRLELLLLALLFALGVWGILRNSEWRFRGEDG